VENYVRLTHYGSRRIVQYEEISFEEEKFLWADASLFDIFSFKLIAGDPSHALIEPNSLVITQNMAEKYFGDEDPLGKNLRINREDLYKITGVVENIPQNSHFRPDFFASFSTLKLEPSGNTAEDLLSNVDYYTYLLLREGTQLQSFQKKLDGFVDKYLGETLKLLNGASTLYAQPLIRIYLHSHQDAQIERTSDITYVYLFTGIGVFILLLACLNFMNLSTARSANRAKEVGLRKAVGAQRPQLIRQFIGESILLTAAALFLSSILVALSLPLFQTISGKILNLNLIYHPVLLAGVLILFALISLLGGSYPAFFLSGYRPVEVLQGRLRQGAKSSLMRIVLVSFQFTVSIVLIIGTLVVSRQLNYMRNKNLGYDKEHVVTLRVRNPETQKMTEAIKSELLTHPNVLGVSASSTLPLGQNSYSAYHAEDRPSFELSMLFSQVVDEDFIDTYRMEIVEGRNFSKEFTTDRESAVIINEAGARELGWQDAPLGKMIEVFLSMEKRKPYKIIGVVKDYHFLPLHQEIQPLLLFSTSPWEGAGSFNRISVRLHPENVQATMAFLESKWSEFDTQYPFEFSFLNDQYDALYRTEERLGRLFGYFTLLAILIGALGMFGLTAFVAEQRTKEIGIRKVLGASATGIVLMLVRDFTKWVLLAVLIAWPIGYFVMNSWLQNFAYRIGLGVGMFVAAAMLALAIGILTVGYQTLKASLANPADSLHYE
jgi:putative ABC transport system permease protein